MSTRTFLLLFSGWKLLRWWWGTMQARRELALAFRMTAFDISSMVDARLFLDGDLTAEELNARSDKRAKEMWNGR